MAVTSFAGNRKSRRGITALYAIVMLTVMAGFVSLGVDYGHVQLVKMQLQRAADAAARAACSGLITDVATAKSMAVQYGGLNAADGSSVVLDSTNDIEFGTWDSTARTFTTLSGAACANANAVRVTARRTGARGNAVPLTFGAVIGRSNCDVNGAAIAWRRNVLFVVGSLTLPTSDQAQYNRLAGLGYSVTTTTDSAVVAGDAVGKTLVFCSESVASGTIGAKLRDVATPLIMCEGNSFYNMKFTNSTVGTDYNDDANYEQVTVSNSAHPLAAGLSGTITVYPDGWGEMNWGLPSSNATKVAYMTGYPSEWTIFCYDSGATMCGGYVAQARRVGLFMRQPDISHTTSNCWLFFDAAVKWAVGDL